MTSSTTITLRDRLSAENLRQLHHAHGLSVREIAARLDVSNTTIYRAMAGNGISVQPCEVDNYKPKLAEVLTEEHLTGHLEDEQLTVA